MKKLFALLAIILIIALVGCENKRTPDIQSELDNSSTDDTNRKTVPAPDVPNTISELTMDEYKELNLFLSNFVETTMYYYNATDGFSQTQITVFAIQHIFINDRSSITTINGTPDPIYGVCDYSVDAQKVDDVLAKYVGSHQKGGLPVRSDGWDSGEYYYFENEKYYFSMWNLFCADWAQAVALYDNNDGTYTVSLDVYSLYDMYGNISEFPENRYEPKDNWGELSDIESGGSRCAVIRKGTWNGTEVWQLVSFDFL